MLENGTYNDYASLKDVYGVTANLKVYYCSNGKDSIIGVNSDELDADNPLRSVLNSNQNTALYNAVAKFDRDKDGTISAEEAKSIDEITIDSESGIASLKELYNFMALKKIYLKNLNMNSLDGIENCTLLEYISCTNCVIGNYSAIGKMGSRLTTLYFFDIDDTEIGKICSKTIGIGNYNLDKLSNLCFSGTKSYISSCSIYLTQYIEATIERYRIGEKTGTKSITKLTDLNNLTDSTKKAVKYLSIGCNEIESLSGLEGFSSLYLLRAERNKLKNLNGIGNLNSLTYLYVPYNNLESLTTFSEASSLYELCVTENSNLKSLSGIDKCSKLAYLYAMNCNLGSTIESMSSISQTDSLYSLKNKSKLCWIDLSNNSSIRWIEYLSDDTAIRYIRLTGCTNINKTSIAKIKSIIRLAGNKAFIPSQYSLALLDSETTILDLSNQEITYDDFEVLNTYSLIEKLSLKNIKIYKENEDGTTSEMTSPTEINTLFSETLSQLTNMKYLQLYGCKYLSDISFVNSMSGLKELDLRGTNVTNLSILETKTNNETLSLGCLCVNTVGTNLSLIPKTIEGLWMSKIRLLVTSR